MKNISLAEILELSVAERLQLIGEIWDSIEQIPDELPLSDAQREELDRRLEAYRHDPTAGSPWPEVKKRLLARRSPSE